MWLILSTLLPVIDALLGACCGLLLLAAIALIGTWICGAAQLVLPDLEFIWMFGVLSLYLSIAAAILLVMYRWLVLWLEPR